jgi:hypothetical protein
MVRPPSEIILLLFQSPGLLVTVLQRRSSATGSSIPGILPRIRWKLAHMSRPVGSGYEPEITSS